jgi:hypothetical protein
MIQAAAYTTARVVTAVTRLQRGQNHVRRVDAGWVIRYGRTTPGPSLLEEGSRTLAPRRQGKKAMTYIVPGRAADEPSSPPFFKEGTGVVPLLACQAASSDQSLAGVNRCALQTLRESSRVTNARQPYPHVPWLPASTCRGRASLAHGDTLDVPISGYGYDFIIQRSLPDPAKHEAS